MEPAINRVAVIGAGTMGAAIAAHIANAGVPVYLLDIVPNALTPLEQSKGLTLDHPSVRNRIVQQGLDRAKKASPSAFFTPEHALLVTIGNLEDDFGWLAEADWIVEAIVENLEAKKRLMARIETVRQSRTIVSTNTSGIPISAIGGECSLEFKAHFLGTHFSNPPRYLKMLEVIPTSATDPQVTETIVRFGDRALGKGVVVCKDTPNFVANRIGSVTAAFALGFALDNGYSVEEVDAITGPLIGRPKTATFRLGDLVGLDVSNAVATNLYPAIPDDPDREVLSAPKVRQLFNTLIARNALGNKTGRGFYKAVTNENGEREFLVLDLQTLDYRAPQNVSIDSVAKAGKLEDLGQRLRTLLTAEDRAGRYLSTVIHFSLAYAAKRVPEIADSFVAIDNAVRWCFAHELGPFQIWEVLGVAETARRMDDSGLVVAPWVKEMLGSGQASFYRYDGQRAVGYYDIASKSYQPLPRSDLIVLRDAKNEGKIVKQNLSASVLDIGDDVVCLEFHSKMNALDPDIVEMIGIALDVAKQNFAGLVIGNEGEAFCAGANIFNLAVGAQQGAWDVIEQALKAAQDAMMALRYSPMPVVAAPFNVTVGAGAEIAMASSRVCASSELYIGQVEMGVGVIPAAGGCKELIRRVISPPMKTPGTSPLTFLQRVFELIALAKVSASAHEARSMGFLDDTSRIVMNRDALITEAKRMVLDLAASGYRPPIPSRNVYASGSAALAALQIVLHQMETGKQASEHDAKITRRLAYVLCGGDLSEGQWVPEQYILDLEREAFLSLLGEPKTLQRIWHMLQTGKPLRN